MAEAAPEAGTSGLGARQRGSGVKVAHVAAPRPHHLRPSPWPMLLRAPLGGGVAGPPRCYDVNDASGRTGNAATASAPAGGDSRRGALMMTARTTTTGISRTAVAAMRPVARRALPQSARADGGRSKRRGMSKEHTQICLPRRKRPSNGG